MTGGSSIPAGHIPFLRQEYANGHFPSSRYTMYHFFQFPTRGNGWFVVVLFEPFAPEDAQLIILFTALDDNPASVHVEHVALAQQPAFKGYWGGIKQFGRCFDFEVPGREAGYAAVVVIFFITAAVEGIIITM